MRIYERYFARQIYLAFIFILFAFSGLFFFFDLINELNTVGHGNYKFTLAVLRVALQTPSRFYEIIPVAALISANGKVLATTGFSRPCSHQRNNSARLRLTSTGSRAA